jgi:diaminohydroxyphosphoribosylaminopyrimidine deaminase/5-amino-6-(5-phosphoribosylamino)uracil reductase
MKSDTSDVAYMQRALDLAARALGRTSPNPAVGAVIVRGNRIVGEGFHRKAGRPHAEIEVLKNLAGTAKGATLYVNLEPCSHHGRTPPCADAVIQAGIKRVVIGMADPNPLVKGRGIRRLRRAGVEVKTGVLRQACEQLNEDFSLLIRTGRPMVTLKLAASLDGRIATVSGDSRWISGASSRRWVHELRNQVDAILVGSGTVGSDNPQLTCRIRGGRDPLRVILDSRLSTNPQARTYTQKSTASTLIATTSVGAKRQYLFEHCNPARVEIVPFSAQNGRVPIPLVLAELGKRGIKHVLIEGGGQVAAAALGEDVVDKVLFFYGPILLGGDGQAMIGTLGISQVAAGKKLHTVQVTQRGEDVVVSAYVHRPGEKTPKRESQ